MQRDITGKFFIVQYILSHKGSFQLARQVNVHHKKFGTLNTFDKLFPLNKVKVIFKGSS